MSVEQEILISCLCVTENRPAFMPWLVWNYDRQTWSNRELIIVDSSVVPFASDRPDIRVVPAPSDSGVAAKRNLALRTAQGEIITWFDDDDWQHPEKLALLAETLKNKSVVYAGARDAWFVELATGRCARHRGANHEPVFNSAGFRREAVQSVQFPEKQRKASDTRWMQALQRRFPRQVSLLSHEDLFFWLCHEENLSNPAKKRRFHRQPEELKNMIGEAWRDTEEALEALRLRLKMNFQGTKPIKGMPQKQKNSTISSGKKRLEPVVNVLSKAEKIQIEGNNVPVSVMIKTTVQDVPYLDVMVRHMISQAKYPFVERVLVVDRQTSFNGKYRNRPRAGHDELDRILNQLLDDGIADRVLEVEKTLSKKNEIMKRYFAQDAQRVPEYAVTGGPIYPTLFGMDALKTDFVLQMDSDVFFHTGKESWVTQALECMANDAQLWLMMTHPGPPLDSPGRSMGPQNMRLANWDRRLGIWRFKTATTRYFLCNRQNLHEQLRFEARPGGCAPLEVCISKALQRNKAYRGALGNLESWHLHAWHHGDPFPKWAPELTKVIVAGKYPDLQRGRYDLRLDRTPDRRAWQVVLDQQGNKSKNKKKDESGSLSRSSLKVPEVISQPGEQVPVAVVIPVRDRAGKRLENALCSLDWQSHGSPAQILVVSHGSQQAFERELAQLCKKIGATFLSFGNSTEPWNKPLALNVGIRTTLPETPFVMTMDIDMILAPNFLQVVFTRLNQHPGSLILCRSLDLPQYIRLPNSRVSLHNNYSYLQSRGRLRGKSGTGGIQAASRDFFFTIRGYDEDLLWWGAMDGDLVNRARLAGLQIQWIENETSMLHQWHPRKHANLTRQTEVRAAMKAWRRNHEIVQSRAESLQRNPNGWGEPTRSREISFEKPTQ